MCHFMTFLAVQPVKGCPAVACCSSYIEEVFLLCVCYFMTFLVAQMAEGFLAVATFVRLFSCVSFHDVSCCPTG